MGRRVVTEIAFLLLWVVGGSVALLATVPRLEAAAVAASEQQQEDLLADLNAFRLLSGAGGVELDQRLSDLVAANSARSISLAELIERQSLLCERSDWLAIEAPTRESLLAALSRASANRHPTAAAVRGLGYTHVGASIAPDPTGPGVVYRLLMCGAREPVARDAEPRHVSASVPKHVGWPHLNFGSLELGGGRVLAAEWDRACGSAPPVARSVLLV